MIYALVGIFAALFGYIQWGDDIHMPQLKDAREQEVNYVHKVNKQEEKEKYKRAKLNRNPSGYMTVEEYEALSAPKDKKAENIEIPKIEKTSDMKYVPQPSYKIVRYNNPPGSPEISLNKTFYTNRQQNAQGVVSPDYSKMVYSSIYYYPVNGSTSCDLFVMPLDDSKTNMDKIKTAHVIKRDATPIMSTDKTIDNYATFRTLTPVDFSQDSSKILVKEKIGNTTDGIWKTSALVYDFTTKTSYNLLEIRDAIIYYWKENEGLNLDDKRWDIYPLGFDLNNPDRVIITALGYTGDNPINLGTWSIDSKGEQSRLIGFDAKAVEVSMNGLKIVKDGVIPKTVSDAEEKQMKRIERDVAKQKKQEDKKEVKTLNNAYKGRIKEMNAEYRQQQKDYKLKRSIYGSTSTNEAAEKYIEVKAKRDAEAQKLLEKKKEKELQKLQKLKQKEEKKKKENI